MSLPVKLKEILPTLELTTESAHFIIHYGLRNPPIGRGLGPHGVRDALLIETYVEALEALYTRLISPPWNRQSPIVGKEGKTHVYVFDCGLRPFTMFDEEKGPLIGLSSRNNEPTTQAELHRAAAEAVHEATHVFNYRERPFAELSSEPWIWFDEGFAVMMEMMVAPGNPDYFRFLMDWIDSPHIPLDHPSVRYQAGMFLQYLVNSLGPEFVNNVWTKSDEFEAPLEALERMMPAGKKFFSSQHDIRDVFSSGYSIDPYCLWNHALEVYLRYGERAVLESLSLPKDADRPVKGNIDHLACCYFRFYLEDGITNVSVRMDVKDPHHQTPLKAEIAIVTKDREKIRIEPLTPDNTSNGSVACLSCTLPGLEADKIDHLVLVVSNSGTRSPVSGHFKINDDDKEFVITAKAN